MTIKKPLNPYRSGLVVPAHKPRFIEKSNQSNADMITFDLEDSVLPGEKEAARANIKDAILFGARGGADIFVRINNEDDLFEKDLDGSVYHGLDGVTIPKLESVERMLEIENRIALLEQERGIEPGHIKTNMLIETAKGYVNMENLCANSRRGHSINIGTYDFATDIGIKVDEPDALWFPNASMVIVAKAYHLLPMGLVASFGDFKDLEHFERVIKESVKVGLKGAWGIHPSQISLLNKGFSPTSEEVAYSKSVIEVFEESKRHKDGAIALNGKMIDKPIVERARAILERQNLIDEFEAYKKQSVSAATIT